jgi:Ca2+/H+ antiporter
MCSIAAAAVSFLMIPQIVYASDEPASNVAVINQNVLTLSQGVALVLLEVYALYTFFRLLPASDFLDERVFLGEGRTRRIFSSAPPIVVLGLSLFMASVNGAYAVDSMPYLWEQTYVSKTFVGMILVPSIISCAELAPAVFFTYGYVCGVNAFVLVSYSNLFAVRITSESVACFVLR